MDDFGGSVTGLFAAHSLEMELRQYCDRIFERPPAADNPLAKLIQRSLSVEEARSLWGARWQAQMILNQLVSPRLLEGCPDVDARVQLWQTIFPEYGRGTFSNSGPIVFRNFLTSLGLPEAQCSLASPPVDPTKAGDLGNLEKRGWLELLILGALGPATIAAKVFPLINDSLALTFNLSEDDLLYFEIGAEKGRRDAEILFSLVTRYTTTSAQRETVRTVLQDFYESSVNAQFACALGPLAYSFVDSAKGVPRRLDRRRDARSRVDIPILLDPPSSGDDSTKKTRAEGSILDISPSGALASTAALSPTGSTIRVSLRNPRSDEQLEVSAKVVRIAFSGEGKPFAMGLEFDEATRPQITTFLQSIGHAFPVEASSYGGRLFPRTGRGRRGAK